MLGIFDYSRLFHFQETCVVGDGSVLVLAALDRAAQGSSLALTGTPRILGKTSSQSSLQQQEVLQTTAPPHKASNSADLFDTNKSETTIIMELIQIANG